MFRFVLVGRFLHSSGPKKDRGPLQIGTRSPFTSSNPSYSAAISASSNLRKCIGKIAVSASSQQQQSQANWSRLEIKLKKHKGHGSGTLIASLQALLSKTTSSASSNLRKCTGKNSRFNIVEFKQVYWQNSHFDSSTLI